jgi:hypothetical protein
MVHVTAFHIEARPANNKLELEPRPERTRHFHDNLSILSNGYFSFHLKLKRLKWVLLVFGM